MRGKRRTASRYSSRFGPARAPSRSTSVHSTCCRPTSPYGSRASHSVCVDWVCQPWVATRGTPSASRRTSKASTSRSGPNRCSQRRTASTWVTAALPITHALCTDGQHARDCRGVAQSAADLQRQRIAARELVDDAGIALAAVARTIQVDDVQPAGAGGAVSFQQRERFRLVTRLCREVALVAAARSVRRADRWRGSVASGSGNCAVPARRVRRSARDGTARHRSCATRRRR